MISYYLNSYTSYGIHPRLSAINCDNNLSHFWIFPNTCLVHSIASLYLLGRVCLQRIEYFTTELQSCKSVGGNNVSGSDGWFIYIKAFTCIVCPSELFEVIQSVTGMIYMVQETVPAKKDGGATSLFFSMASFTRGTMASASGVNQLMPPINTIPAYSAGMSWIP